MSEVKSSVLGVITARGGSKGIPRKNLALLAGKSMIRWTIEEAMRSCWLERVVVSTDDREISEVVARTCGAEVPFIRPKGLAEDDSSHMDILLHLVNWLMIHDKYTPEYIMLLQPTSLLRTAKDIDGAIKLAARKKAEAVISVSETHHHPDLVLRTTEDGTLTRYMQRGT